MMLRTKHKTNNAFDIFLAQDRHPFDEVQLHPADFLTAKILPRSSQVDTNWHVNCLYIFR